MCEKIVIIPLRKYIYLIIRSFIILHILLNVMGCGVGMAQHKGSRNLDVTGSVNLPTLIQVTRSPRAGPFGPTPITSIILISDGHINFGIYV